MHELDSRLLLAIASENERVRGLSPYRKMKDNPQEWAARSQSLKLIDEFGVRVRSDWLGSLPAQRKALFRSLERIEVAGLVEVFTTGRIKFVKLTASGWEALGEISNVD